MEAFKDRNVWWPVTVLELHQPPKPSRYNTRRTKVSMPLSSTPSDGGSVGYVHGKLMYHKYRNYEIEYSNVVFLGLSESGHCQLYSPSVDNTQPGQLCTWMYTDGNKIEDCLLYTSDAADD